MVLYFASYPYPSPDWHKARSHGIPGIMILFLSVMPGYSTLWISPFSILVLFHPALVNGRLFPLRSLTHSPFLVFPGRLRFSRTRLPPIPYPTGLYPLFLAAILSSPPLPPAPRTLTKEMTSTFGVLLHLLFSGTPLPPPFNFLRDRRIIPCPPLFSLSELTLLSVPRRTLWNLFPQAESLTFLPPHSIAPEALP